MSAMTRTTYRIGIDVGGTFTDLVAVDSAGVTTFTKSASTPQDQSIGVLNGLEDLAVRFGLDLAGLLGATECIVHGTTVATNALLERKGARVGLLASEGHRDILEMREGLKPERYNLLLPAPEPLAQRGLRHGVCERILHDGSVAVPLDIAQLDGAIAALKQAGAEAVAICFLHAYRNPDHEQQTAARVRAALPGVYVSVSSEVLPQIKEFERTSTTVVNAYVGPVVERYLSSLERRLRDAGLVGPVFIILSHGGMAPIAEACRIPVATVLSGPAGGVAGARRVAQLTGVTDLVPFDMGGTSTDISLISDFAGERIALRSLDIASIGAGGGSIARVDPGGLLRVGPESAGARPGPACYGHGGAEATVTDANLLLGYLDAANFLGGRARLDPAAAESVVGRIAERLGLGLPETAAGIVRLVNMHMADGIRMMTLRRGIDPRGFTLLSFGGAAGLHAVEVAREREMRRVIVPTVASVLSAWGMLASSLRYEASRSHLVDCARLAPAELAEAFAALEHDARQQMSAWHSGGARIERTAAMRYGEQIFEIEVSLDGLDIAGADGVALLVERFHARHKALYTYASPDQEVVLVNLRVAVVGDAPALTPPSIAASHAPSTQRHRQAFIGGWREVPVHDFAALAPGERLVGPAIIEAETTTVLLGVDDTLVVNDLGWLDITLRTAD